MIVIQIVGLVALVIVLLVGLWTIATGIQFIKLFKNK